MDHGQIGVGKSTTADTLDYPRLRERINTACMNCHLVPNRSGGFSYTDSFRARELTVKGVTKTFPGIYEAAEKMAEALTTGDTEARMPPVSVRKSNPEAFMKLGEDLKKWMALGKPENTAEPAPQAKATSQEDRFDCVPKSEVIGGDSARDRMFAEMTELPKSLSETDLFTLDALELARKGTVAYSVEYPLWADNAEKGRYIHLPLNKESGLRESVVFDAATGKFNIPENTRFYKSFYKEVTRADGTRVYRRVETRLIVVRSPWTRSLFGSYRWDDSETSARLLDTPYRDGSPFKDTLTLLVIDERTGDKRKLLFPGRQRCIECHMGAENQSAVLGFTPLQINRRAKGEGGGENDPLAHELAQIDRLRAYGFLSGVGNAAALPKLERMGESSPRDEHELRAQAYLVGNCAHCHNPLGSAFSKENGIQLALTPGAIFHFNTQTRSVQMPTRRIVHQSGDPEQSQIYRKMADPPDKQGMTSQMPMHTPGLPNCHSLRLIGRWIKSVANAADAGSWEPACEANTDFPWIDYDLTWSKSDGYTPRRADWNDPLNGMPEKYRKMRYSPALDWVLMGNFPVGYWAQKDVCRFPERSLSPEWVKPWMLKDGSPKRPFGEIYYTSPGAWFYRTSCAKCHGTKADGDSSLAKGILIWSGGAVRVPNFMEGMFGKGGDNLKTFERDGANYAGNYLIWMAMEGTRVKFPAELSGYLGSHGGQMLNLLRQKCLNQISTERPSSPLFMDHQVFEAVCFVDNLRPRHPDLAYDPATNQPLNPAAVEAWADRAASNVGWAIFKHLSDTARGKFTPGNDECEKLYPKP